MAVASCGGGLTAEVAHHASGPLGVAVGLAATAGFVDAFVYLRVAPVFVANMSGNLIRLGMATGQRNGSAVVAALIALGGFIAGAIAAAIEINRHVRRGSRPNPAPILIVEALLLAAAALIVRIEHIRFSPTVGAADYAVIVIAAVAMGAQATALRRVGRIAVSTTYGTGAVVRLAEKIALAVRRAERPDGQRRRVTIAVLSVILVSYVAGAAIAAAMSRSSLVLLLPIAATMAAGIVVHRQGEL
ncbi:MAG TPA: YoaK family protein [Ilumatobacteraceae bacterium]